MNRSNAVQRFADFVLGIEFDHIPAEARRSATVFLLDTIAVGVAGSATDTAAAVVRAANAWGDGQAASILGTGRRMPATSAAFVNGFQIHCMEFDCLHEPAAVHAMAVVCGALFAYAEENGCSGRDVMLGVAVGVDVAVGLGLAATAGMRFFRPATAGAMGATAALARLSRFDRRQFMDAWGLTYSQLAGTMQAHVEGSVALPLQIGGAARAVITSIGLVRQGLGGPHDILEGPYGYFELFEPEPELEPVLRELGNTWRVTELAHKPFPTGRAAHATLEALQRLQANGPLQMEQIESVTAWVPPLVKRLVDRPIRPDMGVNYARLCLQYLVPILLRTGALDTGSFTEALLRDPEILKQGRKVHVRDDGSPDPNALGPQRIEVVMRDGARLEAAVPHTLGSPDNPLSRDQYLNKFFHCLQSAGMARPQAEHLLQSVENLSDVDDFSTLIPLACAPTGAGQHDG